jgi:hypothetical protein
MGAGSPGGRPGNGNILAFILVVCVLSACCINEETPSLASVGGSTPGSDVPLQNIGDVTGQRGVLQGVPRGTIDTITFAISAVPGVRSVDINNLTIIYADAVRTETLTTVDGYRGNPPPGYWGVIGVVNEVGNPNLRLEYEEQFIIRINPKVPLIPNQVITISVKPETGKPLIIRRVIPSVITDDDTVLLAV